MPRPTPPSIATLVARWGAWGRGSSQEQPVLFRWSARQHDGRLVQGHSRAAGEHHVRALLRSQGLRPLSVERSRPQAIALRELVTFTRQLATLLGAGMALMQALQTIRQGLGHAGLAELILLRRVNRLSITPVDAAHWALICGLLQVAAPR